MTLVCAIESVGGVDIYDDDFPPLPGLPDNVLPEDFKAWTAGIMRGAWKVIATTAGVSLETLYAMAVTRARGDLLGAHRVETCPRATRSWPASAPAARERGSG